MLLNPKGLCLLAVLLTQTTFTEHSRKADDCFTSADVHIPVFDQKSFREGEVTGISEEDFMMVLDEVETIYTPVFEELGKTFVVNRLWSNSSVNASAQQSGNKWTINMYGGLARHKFATLDAFRAVACHEIGHHLAGAPKKKSYWGSSTSWASNEGQSDYYATYQCMKKLIIEGQAAGLAIPSPDLSIYEEEEMTLVEEKCAERFEVREAEESEDGEILIDTNYSACKRAALAGLSLGRLLGSLRDKDVKISLHTPDTKEVSKTNHNHPAAQCRADTYLAGSLCDLDFNTELSNEDPNQGTCNREAGYEYALRPTCWYKPVVTAETDEESKSGSWWPI